MSRFALGVQYKGNNYCGWQKQRHLDNTVQQVLEQALSKVANCSVVTICAGRTDSGVHGLGQVVHFDSLAERSCRNWKMGVNTQLPRDIQVTWVVSVVDYFHARFSAIYRRYQYIIEDNSTGNAIFTNLVTPYRYPLNIDNMHEAAQYLLGEQDFSSFRAAQCQSNTPFRHLDFIRVYRRGCFVIIDIQANAFLYHMVRNIVGALLLIGREKQTIDWLLSVLRAKDRRQAPATAPATGLYLIEVGYDLVYNLPKGGKVLPFVQ